MATMSPTDRSRAGPGADRARAPQAARPDRGIAGAFERAVAVDAAGRPELLPGGRPRPTYLSHGHGSRVWDVDGNEYVDFHNGFGVMCVGHANPAIVDGGAERAARARTSRRPTEGSIVVAEELRRRFGLPQWRFTNSGTESTMDAVHLARAATGATSSSRSRAPTTATTTPCMVSVRPPLDALGRRERPAACLRRGHPRAVTELTRRSRSTTRTLLERVLDDIGERVAGAHPGARDDEHHDHRRRVRLPRAGPRAHRRTASCSSSTRSRPARRSPPAARRALRRHADVVCLAKAIGGGYPGGAIGMTEELAALIAAATVRQVGTFNGNPLVMAAARGR
jgi:glutamate-1-semialdehyde 2,1-aminomutase